MDLVGIEIPRTHIKTIKAFALWMRDNDVKYCTQKYNGTMFLVEDKEYNLEDLILLFERDEHV